jgi:hypothetical protein
MDADKAPKMSPNLCVSSTPRSGSAKSTPSTNTAAPRDTLLIDQRIPTAFTYLRPSVVGISVFGLASSAASRKLNQR